MASAHDPLPLFTCHQVTENSLIRCLASREIKASKSSVTSIQTWSFTSQLYQPMLRATILFRLVSHDRHRYLSNNAPSDSSNSNSWKLPTLRPRQEIAKFTHARLPTYLSHYLGRLPDTQSHKHLYIGNYLSSPRSSLVQSLQSLQSLLHVSSITRSMCHSVGSPRG
jgi:hypothetical protein